MKNTTKETISGYGAFNSINEIVDQFEARKILLVTGRRSYQACGAQATIEQNLSPDTYVRFSDFEVNPKLEDGKRGARLALEAQVDLVVAVGGGSAIDIAKLIKALLTEPEDAEALVRGDIPLEANGIPLVAIPTTAGSGSEATHFAVVYIGKNKYSLASPSLLPSRTVLDGSLLKSASPYQKAVNGLDALAQAIEGCWAANSTDQSREYSLDAIRLIVAHLPAIVNSNNEADLQNMMRASNLAGQSINISKTTAPHAFSYAFTSYHDIPHGHAVWLTLPEIFAIHATAANDKVSDPRGVEHFKSIMQQLVSALGIDSASDSAAFLRNFMQKLGIEGDMRKMKIEDPEQRKFLSAQVNAQRLANNPVIIDEGDIGRIFYLR